MNYELKKVFERYKMWILHTIMTFISFSLTVGLLALFFRFTHWIFTY